MIDRSTRYAEDVAAGKVVCGELHRLACERHLRDLARQGSPDFPYHWRPEKAGRIIEYAEMLTIAEGAEPKPVRLKGFQDFDIALPFGWYRADGNRRFRRKYKSVARQNGKTFENGITGTYIAGFSGYRYGKLFTVATKKRQARLAWEEMQKFIEIDPEMSELFRVQDYKSLITALDTRCSIEALSKEAGLDDGFRSIYSSIDEIHQHKDNSVYKALYNGTRSLPETLVSMITTRGKVLNGFCREMDDYCIKILSGTSTAEDFFVDIYAPDKGDDPFDPSVWPKANPLLCMTDKGMEVMANDAKTARDMGGSDLSDYLTKCMNMWAANTDTQYIDPSAWAVCGEDLPLSAMQGRACYVGLDLSSGGDLTTLALVIPLGDGRYYVWSHSFMPRARFAEHIITDLAPYDVWEQQGLLTVTGGESDFKNDYAFIIAKLREILSAFELKLLGVAYDPHNADGILAQLEDFGAPLLMVKQSARELDAATQAFQLDVKSGTVRFDRRSELMSWSMTNAKVVRNSFGEMKVDKEPTARHKRIDPVDAVIDAVHMMIKLSGAGAPPDRQAEMETYLKQMGWM